MANDPVFVQWFASDTLTPHVGRLIFASHYPNSCATGRKRLALPVASVASGPGVRCSRLSATFQVHALGQNPSSRTG
jgi:hypothetical protein